MTGCARCGSPWRASTAMRARLRRCLRMRPASTGGLANLALGSARLAADALSHGGDRSPVAAGEALLLRLDRELGGVS